MQKTAWSRHVLRNLFLSCALLGAGCSQIAEWLTGEGWKSPRVVKVTGVEKLDRSPSLNFTARPGRPVGILARDGDLFLLRGGGFFYREGDGDSLLVEERGGVVFLNGKAVSLMLSNESAGWEWLRKATLDDLADLRLLIVETNTLDSSLLEKIARHRPNIGLAVGTDEPDVAARVMSLFEPRFLSIELKVLSARLGVIEPRLAKLETLWIDGKGSLEFLPRLPRLRALLLHKVEDLSFLRNVTGLKELVVWGDLKDVTTLAALPELKKLSLIDSKNLVDLSVLERLPKLAWLEFPRDTSQETFAKVIAGHPDLEVVVLASKHVRDLSPLQSLRHPRAVILAVKGDVDLTPLHQLKTLEYLGLGKDAFKDEAARKTEALEKALPDTFVGQVQPFCLGSGWILLLLPLTVLLRKLWRRGIGLGAEAHA